MTSSLLVGMVAALAVAAPGAGPAAAAADTAAPTFDGFTFTPQAVDVSASAATVTVSAHVTDETAVKAPTVTISSDATDQSVGFGTMTLTSGTTTDGTWSRSVTVPTTAAGGTWTVTLYPLQDTLGNSDNTFHNHPTKLIVTNPAADVTAPVLHSYDFTPNRVNVVGSAQTITVTAEMADSTGVKNPYVLLDSDTTTQTLGFGTMTRIAGTAQDGTYSRTITIPTTAAPGAWTVQLYPLEDTVGNSDSKFRSHATKLQVSNAAPTLPGAPALVSARLGWHNITLSWSTPADGNVPITGYTVTTNPGTTNPGTTDPGGDTTTFTPEQVATSDPTKNQATITGLTNGTSYTFTVAATNSVGTGPDSSASNAVTAATVPDAVGSLSVTERRNGLDLSWTAPANNGAPLTSYSVTAVAQSGPGDTLLLDDRPVTGSLSEGDPVSMSLAHLRNDTTYQIVVAYSNAAGEGEWATSGLVHPHGVPDAPGAVATTGSNKAVGVTWAVPVDNGGSAVTGYTVMLTPAGGGVAQTQTVGPGTTAATFSSLTNGATYALSVVATNQYGDSAASTATATPATTPGAATGVAATRGNAQATVRWVAPVDAGGTPITGYRITASPGGITRTVAATARSLAFTGLTNGTRYTFTVAATNAKGTGAASAASAAVVPAGPPAQTAKPTAAAGKKLATVTWKAPAANGSAITQFQVRCSNGETKTVGGGVRSLKFTGLTKGKRLSFQVRAVTAAGTGAYSVASAVVTIK